MKQTEYFGEGSINKLEEILANLKSHNVFLVHGKNSFSKSGAEKKLESLLKNYSVTNFNEFTEIPKLEDIIKGMDIFMEADCDTVIAVGGGSVIDIAKSVNALSSQDEKPKSILEGTAKILNKGKPLIAIPTTSGSGSEATHFAVAYSDNKKYSLAHEFILPDYCITDPELTYSLPKGITATSGMDAFSQAVESYWNVNANEVSKKYSEDAIRLILNNLAKAVNDPDKDNRINMSKAAHLAGKAINITKTTAPHALSYSMTSHFGIPHGQAVSITLGEFLEFNYNASDEDLNRHKSPNELRSDIEDLMKIFGCGNISESRKMINDLLINTRLKTKLSELNITTEDDLKTIISEVNLERLNNNPRKVTKENLELILRNIS